MWFFLNWLGRPLSVLTLDSKKPSYAAEYSLWTQKTLIYTTEYSPWASKILATLLSTLPGHHKA